MTETTPAPADQVIEQAATTALPGQDAIDHGMFVPQATRDNYLTIIRDQAVIRGVDRDVIRTELVEQFRLLHERQPFDGYDHLAGWLEGADVSDAGAPTGLQVLTARALESARRDPYQAVIGDQALVEVAVSTQQAADEQALASAVAPTVDPTTGMLPNSGPLPVPADVTGVPDEVAQQQRAAAEQAQSSDSPTESSQPGTPPPSSSSGPQSSSGTDAPASTDTPPADTTTSTKRSSSSSSS